MKVKRYVAKTMRAALDRVREEMGPDVLILGNRRTEHGIEIMVADPSEVTEVKPGSTAETAALSKTREPAFEHAAAYLGQATGSPSSAGATHAADIGFEGRARTGARAARARDSRDVESPGRGLFEAILGDDEDDSPRLPNIGSSRRAEPVKRTPQPDSAALWTQDTLLSGMQSELRALRDLVQQQISGFAWGSYGSAHPERAMLLRQMVKLGVPPTLAREVLEEVPENLERKTAWHRALGVLAHRIVEYPEQMFDAGGVFLVCGPSGVGKTATIAKIAARRALERGAETLTIVSADNRRIGAHQQLKSIGRILGVNVMQAESVSAIEGFRGLNDPGHLTLIDTAGCYNEADALADEITTLKRRLGVAVMPLTVLAANMDLPTLTRTLSAYQVLEPAAAVITKTDEADTIGAVISSVVEHTLPVAYVSRGPRVPDDLVPAVAHELITDMATRRSIQALDAMDVGLACERAFEHAANWN